MSKEIAKHIKKKNTSVKKLQRRFYDKLGQFVIEAHECVNIIQKAQNFNDGSRKV